MNDDQPERQPTSNASDNAGAKESRTDVAASEPATAIDPDLVERRAAPAPGPSRSGADRTMFPNDPVAGGAPGSGGTGASGGYGADSGWGSSGGSPDGNEGDAAEGGSETDWLRSAEGSKSEEA